MDLWQLGFFVDFFFLSVIFSHEVYLYEASYEMDFAKVSPMKLHGDVIVLMELKTE